MHLTFSISRMLGLLPAVALGAPSPLGSGWEGTQFFATPAACWAALPPPNCEWHDGANHAPCTLGAGEQWQR